MRKIAKKDEVASHKAEEARAIIGEKYTQMRVRGTNSPSETPDVTTSPSVSGQRRFASLRKTTISPHQKLENIEIAKQATENLLKEEQQNIGNYYYFIIIYLITFINSLKK